MGVVNIVEKGNGSKSNVGKQEATEDDPDICTHTETCVYKCIFTVQMNSMNT